ncbi:sigma factor [Pedobacter nototheniae]|uniref:sigma factor n=1 Tax=Pedobacter nototheniae TaxID=2488994 RepID=UPI003977830C
MPTTYHFAFSRLRDEEIARDLVQDTFLAALQQVSRFEGKSSEKIWLTRAR